MTIKIEKRNAPCQPYPRNGNVTEQKPTPAWFVFVADRCVGICRRKKDAVELAGDFGYKAKGE
jgi:hypothetical protein